MDDVEDRFEIQGVKTKGGKGLALRPWLERLELGWERFDTVLERLEPGWERWRKGSKDWRQIKEVADKDSKLT